MHVKTYIAKLVDLVELEREAEIEAMREEMRRLKGYEREKVGRAILNLNGKVIGEEFGFKLVKYGRKEPFKTEIGVGDLIVISKGNPLASDLVGTVVEKGSRFIVVAVEAVPSWAFKNVRIDLYANDVTFRRQLENLKKLSESGIRALKLILGQEAPLKSFPEEFTPFDRNLNQSQKEAVSYALGSDDFFLIHGPFGTGKTRTLVELIIQEVKRGSKVLATAESNVAVDNLVERLWGKVKLVRLGHPSRVSVHLKESTLAFQVESHERYRRVRELRNKAERLAMMRDQYKKPTPQMRRGLTNKQILKLAERGRGTRGVPAKDVRQMAQWITLNEQIQKLYKFAEKIESEIIREIIEDVDVVLSTNSSSALEFIKDVEFDVVIIDEASQATIPSVLIPIAKAKRFILAGDHKQLPPTILSEEAKELSETLFEKLISLYPSKARMLEVQYRMNQLLMEFPSREFYKGRIKADESVKDITLADLKVREPFFGEPWDSILKREEPLVFVDTSDRTDKWERQRKGSTSRENPLEALLVKEIVERLLRIGIKKNWIGVITPYDDQVDLIRSLIEDEDIEIHTVDGYQGREKEVIILSFVRSNKNHELGFLTDLRRLNVSITRAKRKLIAIGDSETLKEHDTYKRFIEFVKRYGRSIRLRNMEIH
ncbi:IGHMBP2 family helicase [Thermococcus argininiproducens]|uniref:IGHMBP2 family helicase n=1 Tax=Thermococcus argininiproducens TaxID=2866384 RepID=A0A9E7MAN0_9EURY|nr:IGHMBP2 family helicase [Thermococcus argininiproducens]USH00406.1 IGHMBP2 family helicase [Thermococcus argininiproducens]